MNNETQTNGKRTTDLIELMTSALGHDIKTPLTNAIGFNSEIPDAQTRTDMLKYTKISGYALSELEATINSINLISEMLKTGRIQTYEINAAKSIKNRAERFANANMITVNYDGILAEQEPTLPVETNEIFLLALRNYLSNANSHGKNANGERTTITLGLYDEGKNFQVSVKDGGVKIITAEKAQTLFEKGVSNSSNVSEGHQGLGLYIVKLAVELLGGEVYHKPVNPGPGNIFGFRLPKDYLNSP
ncbi:MAG: sensor histidine kinase [Candidatus Nanoarchaeia archaeon]